MLRLRTLNLSFLLQEFSPSTGELSNSGSVLRKHPRAGPYYVRIRSQQAMILDQFIAEAGLILLSVFFWGVEFLKQEFTA